MTDQSQKDTDRTMADAMVTLRTSLTRWSLHLITPAPGTPAPVIARAQDQGLDVEVPQSVLAALVREGLAPDVARGGDEDAIEWASNSAWAYRRSIERTADGSRVTLVLEGVDTIATVRVGGEVHTRTDNMFHAWRIDLGVDDSPGQWDIEVEFHPVLPVAQEREARQPLPRADMYDLPFNQVRKMAASFGWDWGPTTVSAGLWREAVLERSPAGRLTATTLTGSWSRSGATLVGELSTDATGASALVHVTEAGSDVKLASATVPLNNGAGQIALDVAAARQWQPRGLGEQPLYDVRIDLIDTTGAVIDRSTKRIGFRTVDLVQTPDENGQSFEIHVNGQRVWARGFNWIPADMLPERVEPAHVRALITAAIDTGANMLRVWGGGTVESAAFYDVCDELGVLVWQDFSFACAAYPEDNAQVQRVEREVADAVARVGHRASLVLWCGCNENLWGYEDWGWKESLAPGQGWGERLYREVIPQALERLDPERPYIPGSPFSPQAGVHPNDQTQGPTHHWDTWNDLDYVEFENKLSRFASEFGWQAPAAWPTLTDAIGREPHGPNDVAVARLQKHPQGQAALARAVADHVPHLPSDGRGWHFATQLVQARALRAAVARFRSLHDYCSGVLWWQLNDCWPALSWSVLDVNMHRKLSWYAAREVFAARTVLPSANGDLAGLTLVNETGGDWLPSGQVRVIDGSGTVLWEHSLQVAVPAGGHAIVSPGSDAGHSAVAVVVDVDGHRAARWLKGDLDLAHPPARVTVTSVRRNGDGVTVGVQATSLVRDLTLMAEHHPALEDAIVDNQLLLLLPGEFAEFTVTARRAQELDVHAWAALLASDSVVETDVAVSLKT